MPNFSTPSGSTQPYIPAIHRDQRNRVPGTVKVFGSKAEMDAAVAVEKSNIALGLPVWFALETLVLASEPIGVQRRWSLTSGGHARTIVVGSKTFDLQGDANIVIATTGLPGAGAGSNGDMALDADTGAVYSKSSGQWTVASAASGTNLTGTLAPEGSVTAPAGAFYGRTGPTPGLFYKMAGAGNTGWVAVSTGAPPSLSAPGAPTSVVATAGTNSASVTGTASSTGGSTINRWRATPTTGSGIPVSASSLPINVTGLTAGTAVAFTLAASNDGGTTYGPESAASNSVTPSAPDSGSSILTLNGKPLVLNNLNLVV